MSHFNFPTILKTGWKHSVFQHTKQILIKNKAKMKNCTIVVGW